MARPLRIEFPNAIYHVTVRGIERRPIVRDDRDRDRWVERLEETVLRRRWRLFAFALMDNHFHLFLQTLEPNLSLGMHDLNGGHAGFFNTRHDRVGPLFQGRFKAILVEAEGHWLEVSRYVHLNPCRARLVARPQQWKWSSYPGYHNPRRAATTHPSWRSSAERPRRADADTVRSSNREWPRSPSHRSLRPCTD